MQVLYRDIGKIKWKSYGDTYYWKKEKLFFRMCESEGDEEDVVRIPSINSNCLEVD